MQSSLIQMNGKNILVDPVFSERSSPVQWAGPARFTNPSVTVDELPDIDAVLITQNHYDYLIVFKYSCLSGSVSPFVKRRGRYRSTSIPFLSSSFDIFSTSETTVSNSNVKLRST